MPQACLCGDGKQALEALAFEEPDPRPRRAAAWALAAAGAACREAQAHAGGDGGGADRAAAAGGAARALQALPADGAMRALAEALSRSLDAGEFKPFAPSKTPSMPMFLRSMCDGAGPLQPLNPPSYLNH